MDLDELSRSCFLQSNEKNRAMIADQLKKKTSLTAKQRLDALEHLFGPAPSGSHGPELGKMVWGVVHLQPEGCAEGLFGLRTGHFPGIWVLGRIWHFDPKGPGNIKKLPVSCVFSMFGGAADTLKRALET